MSDFTDSNSTTECAVSIEPWMVIFVDPTANGTPDKPSKTGFIALTRQGKEVWNAWRNAFPCEMRETNGSIHIEGPKVDLSGYNFKHESLSFKGFLFGDGANFEGSCFEKSAIFTMRNLAIEQIFAVLNLKNLHYFWAPNLAIQLILLVRNLTTKPYFVAPNLKKMQTFLSLGLAMQTLAGHSSAILQIFVA